MQNGSDRDRELIEDLDAFDPQPVGSIRFGGTEYAVWHWKDLPQLQGYQFLRLWDQRATKDARADRARDLAMVKLIVPVLPAAAYEHRAMTDARLASIIIAATAESRLLRAIRLRLGDLSESELSRVSALLDELEESRANPPAEGEAATGASASPTPLPSTGATSPATATRT